MPPEDLCVKGFGPQYVMFLGGSGQCERKRGLGGRSLEGILLGPCFN